MSVLFTFGNRTLNKGIWRLAFYIIQPVYSTPDVANRFMIEIILIQRNIPEGHLISCGFWIQRKPEKLVRT